MSASDKEIRAAFLNHVKQLHPDTNTDTKSHEKFVHINEAYNILKAPASRAQYDATLAPKIPRPMYNSMAQPHKTTYKEPKNFEERWQHWKMEEDIMTNRRQKATGNEKIHWQFHLFGLSLVIFFLVLTQFAPNLDNIGAGVKKQRLINEENRINSQRTKLPPAQDKDSW